VIEAAGFVDVQFSERRWDSFSGSASESDAAKFGTQGVAISARKPADAGTLPSPDSVLEALGDGCASLTPRIRARMRQLESGQILEVVSNDRASLEGVPAWSRLTGNALVASDARGENLRFFIRKR
jgi:tRNA 2-thiouridine synthesizing protein A